MKRTENTAVAERPTRRCVISRRRAPQHALLRLALGPRGEPFVDVLGRAPGRGVYILPQRRVLAEALSPRGLARAFRGQATQVPEEVVVRMLDETFLRVEARIFELLGLARRAGCLAIGSDAVLRLLSGSPRGTVVVVAEDLSERTLEKIRAVHDGVIRFATKARLALVLGGEAEAVGVVGIRASSFSERVANEAERLAGLLDEEKTREND